MQAQIKNVKDWGKFNTPSEHDAKIEELLKCMHEIEARLDEDWQIVVDKPGLKVYCPSQKRDVKVLSCYAHATLDCSASVALQVLNDENLLKDMDPNVDKLTVLERDHHNRFTHVVMKGMYYTAPREVVTLDHWRVDENGAVLKAAFSVDRQDVPEHPDPSVRIRAFTEAWTMIIPDAHDDNKTHVKFQVDIDVRLEFVPQWVLKMVAGSAQKVNARDFATNLKQVNTICQKRQRALPKSHLIVNQGGKAIVELDANTSSVEEEKVLDFSDLRTIDVIIPFILVTCFSAAHWLAVSAAAAAAAASD